MLLIFIKAILIGLAASIPLGPLGIMCIQKTLSKGRWSGFAVGLGAALGDTFYAVISLFSISFLSSFLNESSDWVMLVGGLIIFVIGLQIAIKNPIKDLQRHKVQPASLPAKDVLRGLLMTLSNPGALVLMLGLFAFFRLSLADVGGNPIAIAVVVGGILLGTTGWWFLLSGGIGPDDVERVKAFSHPMCVGIDLNSRFETEPGVKDVEKLRTFVGALRQ